MQESFGAYIPFVEHLGFEMVYFEDGQSEMRYTPEPEHMNSFNVTHGGAIMTLLDVSMATAARSIDRTLGVVTVEMKTSFMQPARGNLIAKGRLIYRSQSMAFTESTLFDEAGRACAHATGTFKYVNKAPDTHHTLQELHEISTD